MLVVKVPVLSEQMTEVQPSVSTEGRDLIFEIVKKSPFYIASLRVIPNDGILLCHTTGTQSQASCDDGGETLWDCSNGQSDGNFEIVNGTLHP